ncbi:MAG: hypothetical protein K6E95_03645 [Lachnospiraceae bacterium]|nr:hypothetical protein [Lachnospiraceae bacterium]
MYGEIFYEILAVVIAVFVIVSSYRASALQKKRIKYLIELEDYCLELRHRYGEKSVLADAVFAAFDPKRKYIKDFSYRMTMAFGNEGAEGLTAASLGGSLTSPYEKLLVSVCGLIEEFGDNGSGTFGETLLKTVVDMREERRYLLRRLHAFKGLAVTAAVPCLFVLPLGKWAADTIPSLLAFYHGSGGVALRGVILSLSIICAVAVQVLSDPVSFRDRFGKGKTKCRKLRVPKRFLSSFSAFIEKKLKKLDIRIGVGRIWYLSFLFAGAFFITSLTAAFLGHIDMRRDLVYDTSDIENTLGIADTAQINTARRVIPYLMVNTVERGMNYTDNELVDEIMNSGIRSSEDAGRVAMEFYNRLMDYEHEKINAYDLMIMLALATAGWFMPVGGLLVVETALGSRVREEVMQFEAVIDIEKDVNGMTVPIMLESMICFASVTETALLKTIMDYNTDENNAFRHLTEQSDDRSLKRLAGFFSMTDTLGVRHAFDEVSAELEGMREERRLDRSLRLEDESMLAGILGVIPGGIVIFGYLLVPFISRSLEMFNSYSDSLGMV